MKSELTLLWAKTWRDGTGAWHPLVLHLLDVAASADAILDREPESTRIRMGEILGLEWNDARPWLLLLIACHDLGKASPSFQMKWPARPVIADLQLPRVSIKGAYHGFVSQLALTRLLQEDEWPAQLAELAADAVGCHHGNRPSEPNRDAAEQEIYVGSGERLARIRADWHQARADLFGELRDVFRPTAPPRKEALSGPDFMLLAGLTSFADWIGSNEMWFTYGSPADCRDLNSWFEARRKIAERALDAIGWVSRTPLTTERAQWGAVSKYPPRPLQTTVMSVLDQISKPAVLLIEAPMGEGKTEAVFFAHLELQRRFGHRGMYIALPTKATGNAMFGRTLEFLRSHATNRRLDLQLVHGGNLLNEEFQQIHLSGIYDSSDGGEVRAAEWFTNKKRALLSEYGVGTVDQALVPVLPVRHNFVRLWGLANRVVIFDEIHAYDDYTGTLLVDLTRWLLAMGSSVVLLSATLSSSMRRKWAQAFNTKMPDSEEPYPRLTLFSSGEPVKQWHFPADSARSRRVALERITGDLSEVGEALAKYLPGHGVALALVNTVQRAQDLYRLFPDGEPLIRENARIGKRLPDGTEVLLFHARFPGNVRQEREKHVLAMFGRDGSRDGRRILIATQVAEQSLDLDFDLIVTDLAPIDLLLQRAGRLWRHERADRKIPAPTFVVAGLAGAEPPSFLSPLWWGKVYREDLLLRTWYLLHDKAILELPGEIDLLVDAVYEDQVPIPAEMGERMQKASDDGEGAAFANRQHAKMAIIGFPDDASWNDPSRFVLYDEDAPGVHRTLMAQTRLGQDSILAIPLKAESDFRGEIVPNKDDAKAWFGRAISVSRPSVVRTLRTNGIPKGWEQSPLLRNCYPMVLDEMGRWTDNTTVRLDEDLGLVYDPKEPQ